MKLKPVRDQVIVITGASSGIGVATAKEAARRGARVVLNSRDEADLARAVDEVRAEGGQAAYDVGDVGDFRRCSASPRRPCVNSAGSIRG
jgi:NAD(P)-dependent dehydrogenase (short-subunit alcohol dehydrogenase family)